MAISNTEIGDLFDRLANLLEIEGANPFRVRAYRDAARTVRNHSQSMAGLIERGDDLSRLPGIGKDLAGKIETLVETGRLPALEEAEARTPPPLGELLKIEALGPKRVQALYKKLKVRSLDGLRRVAEQGKIRELSGFGEKTEQMILSRARQFAGGERRFKLNAAEDIAEPLIAYLKQSRGIKDIAVAGSYRRRKETVGDLDILITARKDSSVMDRLVNYEAVEEVISRGKTRSTVVLRAGMQVDVRVVPQVSYGAALHYFTGSKAHNIAVRKLGVRRGYKVNEYGVFKNGKRLAGRTEQEVYKLFKLAYVEPELREGRGEIEAARENRLPELVRERDLRGDLHCHTNATDGRNTLEEMAAAAARRGYQYLSITDHSQRLTMAKGLNKKRLFEQIKAIDKFNERSSGIIILKSIEVDILEDGSLDLPDSVLKELDFTVCSVHYKFDLPGKKQTTRLIRAMDNRHFGILGHPSGRLIGEREPCAADLEKVMQAAAERNRFLEINARPERLDLTDDACLLAKELGVKLAVSSDSHSVEHLDLIRYGVNQARRGWLEAGDIINTRPLGELRKLFADARQ